ncbi:MAG: hypothetical protein H6977_21185 [Gammaproteobacteria bacterium]|nr:hypothetical protein [Gammaproteobacteria bacterium]MCP5202519.1 hypothetical protein [Gammaproteobacteria bacterium]
MKTCTAAQGFGYVELLTAIVVLAVCLAPALEALGQGGRLAALAGDEMAARLRLGSCMEETLARPYSTLAAHVTAPGVAGGLSDAPDAAPRCLVYVQAWDGDDADADGDGSTGADPDLLAVRVAIDATPLATSSLVAP